MRESEMEGFVVFSWVGFGNPFLHTIVDMVVSVGYLRSLHVFRQTKRSGGGRNAQVSCQVNNGK